MAFDMCSHCFFKEISYIMEIPSKIYLCAGLFSTGKIFIEVCVIIRLNLKRPQISAHKVDSFVLAAVFVCVRNNTQTNCHRVSSQFICICRILQTPLEEYYVEYLLRQEGKKHTLVETLDPELENYQVIT